MKQILKLLIVCLIFTSCGSEVKKSEQKGWVRKNANSPEATKDLEALNKALSIMKQKNCSDPLSWYYQGSIHWVPDTIKNNSLCETYHSPVDLKEAWDNCTHTPGGQEKIHFLVWHRLYIWHFEKIVRKLSGYEDFSLPYWAYTNLNQSDKILPKTLRDKNSSLYEEARFSELNEGKPVSGEIERALDLTNLMQYQNFKSFSYAINGAPHGAMHDYIGSGNDTTGTLQFNNKITGGVTNNGLMGWVPTAGFDPVFWLHHSNIDRIWQQWTNSTNGKRVTLEELETAPWPYVFFDEEGKKVEYTLDSIMKIIYTMDYDFDDINLTSKSETTSLMAKRNDTLAKKSINVSVSNQITDAVTVVLKPTTAKPNRVTLELTVSFTKVPKGIYEVYNSHTEGNKPSDSNFIGFMNFFGADHKMPGESCQRGCCQELSKEGRPLFTFEWEVDFCEQYNIDVYKHNGKHLGDLKIEKVVIK
jgi:hypothetical protein